MTLAMFTSLQAALPRYSFTRPRRTILVWAIGLLLVVGLGVTAGGDLGTENSLITNPESMQAQELLRSGWGAFDHSDAYPELLIVESPELTIDSQVYRSAVEELVTILE